MTPIRVGIIGIGMMGREHLEILATSPRADLAVACDLDPAVRDAIPGSVPFTTDMERALDTDALEAVLIATPQAHHLPAVKAALERGLAVLCEKPIADTLAAADVLVALGSQPGVDLVIGHMYRFDPRYRAIQEAVAAGSIGRPVQLTSRGNVPDFEGRLLAGRTTLAVENGVHTFDLMQWLAGPIVRVYGEAASTQTLGPDLVDSIVVTVRFASGATGMYATSWIMPSATGHASEHAFSILGSAGLAWIDGRDAGAGIVGSAGLAFPPTITYRDPSGMPYGLYRTEVEHWLAHVRDGRPWPVTLEEARSALACAIAADRSMAEGLPVELAEVPA